MGPEERRLHIGRPMTDVLIVDDDADLASVTAEVLSAIGYAVRTASNGVEALASVAERRPDVIVSDVEMPVLDGPAMAFELNQRDAGSELIPIVLSSGYAELATVAESLGTPYFLKKPCSLDELTFAIERARAERAPPRPRRTQAMVS